MDPFFGPCVEDCTSGTALAPCRYELKSVDAQFESGRRYRMQSQRPR